MFTQEKIKHVAPYALAGAAVAATGLWLWQKARIGLPEGAVPVTNFDADRYLGDWYEIARFDYRFEKGLKNVTAHYAKNPDGSIKVTNRGQDIQSKEWSQSTGKAKFLDDEKTARLKVSFFGPFYAAYTVIALDDDYQYALVAGNDLDYLWLLSRTPEMPDNIRIKYLKQAASIGYDVSQLIWTEQDDADMQAMPTVS